MINLHEPLYTHSNVVIPYEESVEKPRCGTKCEEKRQGEWHVFDTLGSYYLRLQQQKSRRNVTNGRNWSKKIQNGDLILVFSRLED